MLIVIEMKEKDETIFFLTKAGIDLWFRLLLLQRKFQ